MPRSSMEIINGTMVFGRRATFFAAVRPSPFRLYLECAWDEDRHLDC